MAAVRKKAVSGVSCRSADGLVWSWSIDAVRYSWCKLGWLHTESQGIQKRVAFFKTIHGAVAYTMGFHDGLGLADRTRLGEIVQVEKG
jgi:hypothetical protein